MLETYRFFGVNEDAGVLWDCCVGCMGDDEACETAVMLSSANMTIEVWDVARLVGRIPPIPRSAPVDKTTIEEETLIGWPHNAQSRVV